jgi:succinyl-diaminopimelate desuccinylase
MPLRPGPRLPGASVGVVPSLPQRLAARTLELIDIPSESLHEAAIRSHVLSLVPSAFELACEADEAFLFLPARSRKLPLVVLAGHYDTVPAQDNLPGELTDEAVVGLGASDMKSGVAVALELVRDLAGDEGVAYDLGLLLFGREELPVEYDPLPRLLESCEAVREAVLAVLLEPTDGEVHVGCLGHLVADLVFHGRSGHSGRPWLAENAVELAVDGLRPLVALETREVDVGGVRFVESLSVTRLEAGIADNVIPDRAVATLSFRYAPDRTPADAEGYLQSLAPPGATLEIRSNSASGQVVGEQFVRALVDAGARGVAPKLAWTNLADFTAFGIDALNFGPGHTRFAHTRDEQIEIGALVHAYETLRAFLSTPIRDDRD